MTDTSFGSVVYLIFHRNFLVRYWTNMQALLNLPTLVRVDLSHNFLNGPLSLLAGRMTRLEEVSEKKSNSHRR